MLEAVTNAVSVPVIASGGAGCIDDFTKLFKAIPNIDAGLAASIFHFGEVKISDLKKEIKEEVNVNATEVEKELAWVYTDGNDKLTMVKTDEI